MYFHLPLHISLYFRHQIREAAHAGHALKGSFLVASNIAKLQSYWQLKLGVTTGDVNERSWDLPRMSTCTQPSALCTRTLPSLPGPFPLKKVILLCDKKLSLKVRFSNNVLESMIFYCNPSHFEEFLKHL